MHAQPDEAKFGGKQKTLTVAMETCCRAQEGEGEIGVLERETENESALSIRCQATLNTNEAGFDNLLITPVGEPVCVCVCVCVCV